MDQEWRGWTRERKGQTRQVSETSWSKDGKQTKILVRTGRKNMNDEELVAGTHDNGTTVRAFTGLANQTWGVRVLLWWSVSELGMAVKAAQAWKWGDNCCGGEFHCCRPAGTPD